jgi:L-asparaginase II
MIVAEVVRSGFVESRHHGRVVVLDASGAVQESVGEVAAPMFPRSSLKPLQAVGMLRAGFPPADEADLAMISASHWGEPFHLERVRQILARAGLDESALRCPADFPLSEVARRQVREPARVLMNCSGKHAGMLATCVVNGWPLETYAKPDHPLQVALRAAVKELTGESVAATGVDGCGAPLFAISLRALARAFLRLVDAPLGTPERRVADGMRAHPELVAGTGQEDTVLMAGVAGLLSKGGAEGVQAVAVPAVGAVAVKIEDGAMRARMPVVASALRRLGVERTALVPVLGGGRPVGEVRAVW